MSSVPQRRVMISSTRSDLSGYRDEALAIIKRVAIEEQETLQLLPVGMEETVVSGKFLSAIEQSKSWVDRSNWVVVIVGFYYGTVPRTANSKRWSVTEWEYQYASRKRKDTFVFVAHESFRKSENAANDPDELAKWGNEHTEQQRVEFMRFREEVLDRAVNVFTSRADFAKKLADTLRRAVNDAVRETNKEPDHARIVIPPGSALADLLLDVRPSIMQCIGKVKRIATLKRLHDLLHDLYMNSICLISDVALPQWKKDGKPDPQNVETISSSMGYVKGIVRAIIIERDILSRQKETVSKALEQVSDATGGLFFRGSSMSIEDFTIRFTTFALAVQRAFTLVDSAMQDAKTVLNDLHSALESRINAKGNSLGDGERSKLAILIQQVEANRQGLIDVIALHHEWQIEHDEILRLKGYRESPDFGLQVCAFALINLPQLETLVKNEMDSISANDVDGKVMGTSVRSLKRKLITLRKEQDLEAFDPFRTAFDQVFFKIDKRTLAAVMADEQRVKEVEGQLENLAKSQAATVPLSPAEGEKPS